MQKQLTSCQQWCGNEKTSKDYRNKKKALARRLQDDWEKQAEQTIKKNNKDRPKLEYSDFHNKKLIITRQLLMAKNGAALYQNV